MNESQWALFVVVFTVVITRTVDVFLPKGYMVKWAKKYLIKKDDDTPEDDQQDT